MIIKSEKASIVVPRINAGLVPGPLWISKFMGAQILYIKCHSNLYVTYSHPAVYFKSFLDYL